MANKLDIRLMGYAITGTERAWKLRQMRGDVYGATLGNYASLDALIAALIQREICTGPEVRTLLQLENRIVELAGEFAYVLREAATRQWVLERELLVRTATGEINKRGKECE